MTMASKCAEVSRVSFAKQEMEDRKHDSESEDEDDTWALELEEELQLDGRHAQRGFMIMMMIIIPLPVAMENKFTPDKPASAVQEAKKRPSIASEMPQEVLVNILGFVQVRGRVSKAWSIAMSTCARRRFSARLQEILVPFTAVAAPMAHDVEAALFEAYGSQGNPYSLPKAYGQKARQLLFNLKDSRNDLLRDRLVSGDLSADALVRMSARDMANPELVRQRKEWIKKRTHEVMRGEQELDGFTESDMFECRSCGSSRTRYRQWRRKAIVDRTRIIIICLRCPYRWEL